MNQMEIRLLIKRIIKNATPPKKKPMPINSLRWNKFLERHRIPKIEEIDKPNSPMSVKDPLHL